MRKRIGAPAAIEIPVAGGDWLNLEEIAQVEVSSEDSEHPIEAAFSVENPSGWRAAAPGEQTIRLIFDQPQSLRRVQLLFTEDQREREQEFLLSWSTGKDHPFRDIVRQQYHFSPTGAVRELEDFKVELKAVGIIELKIIPDRSGGGGRATLAHLRLA